MVDYKTAKGWMRAEEREELKRLAEEVHPKGCIINIGVEFGASIACLRAGNPFARIIGVDLDTSKLVPDVFNECGPLLFIGDSGNDNMIARVGIVVMDWYEGDKCAGLVLIDGDHHYDGVIRDTAYCEMLCAGGVVAFHDCYDYDHPEHLRNGEWASVNRAVSDWFHDNQAHWTELPKVGTMRLFKKV